MVESPTRTLTRTQPSTLEEESGDGTRRCCRDQHSGVAVGQDSHAALQRSFVFVVHELTKKVPAPWKAEACGCFPQIRLYFSFLDGSRREGEAVVENKKDDEVGFRQAGMGLRRLYKPMRTRCSTRARPDSCGSRVLCSSAQETFIGCLLPPPGKNPDVFGRPAAICEMIGDALFLSNIVIVGMLGLQKRPGGDECRMPSESFLLLCRERSIIHPPCYTVSPRGTVEVSATQAAAATGSNGKKISRWCCFV